MPVRNKALLKSAPKKIVIHNFKKPPQLPDDFYELTAKNLLQGTLSVLQQQQQTNHFISLQNSYQDVVHLVSHQYGPRLYSDLRETMEKACEVVLNGNISTDVAATTFGSLLSYVSTQYQRYCEYLLLVKHVFAPLDRTHYWSLQTSQAVKGSSSLQSCLSVWQVGLNEFGKRLKVLELDETLYREWLGAFLNDWDLKDSLDASAGPDNRSNLQAIWYVWQDLGFLSSLPLQQDLQQYWTKQCVSWQQERPYRAAAFVDFCYQRHVHVTVWPWLPATWLWSILEHNLVQPHLNNEYLLQPTNLFPMLQLELSQQGGNMRDKNTPPIVQLWMMASRLPQGQALVGTAIAQFGKAEGLQIVQSYTKAIAVAQTTQQQLTNIAPSVNATQIVTDLLQLQESMRTLIGRLPQGKDWIHLKSAWEEVCNHDPGLAEQLAKFLDNILRNTKKLDQYQTSDDWLQKIISGIFIPIQSKDIFEAFYRKDLAKRLLWNRVVSMDVEKQVCSLLKAECGAGYTAKLEGMFLDVDFSRETMSVYKQSQANSAASGPVEMDVQVLTTGYWPVYPVYPNLILPESLREPQERFVNHYTTKYQGRRITWQFSLGHCVVRANGFGNKTYDLVVSLCQALVLTQFVSNDTKLGIRKLMELLGLDDRDEMERLLLSLACGKEGTRILRKIDYEQDKKKRSRTTIDDRDEFKINTSFESNQRRIRINNIMMKETKEEREKTVDAISRDRLYLIDAVLVRIMKARKTILHTQLIPQVLEQLKIPAQPADVKKRIETLIERDYMERDAENRNRYNYLA
ncbi:hypothetical protein MPSEU_000022800 [Mayamaea pseudoterrestris]|nr:hypothetical protein MPSEU_000022800 [Mayamaea pseudoterrestris]